MWATEQQQQLALTPQQYQPVSNGLLYPQADKTPTANADADHEDLQAVSSQRQATPPLEPVIQQPRMPPKPISSQLHALSPIQEEHRAVEDGAIGVQRHQQRHKQQHKPRARKQLFIDMANDAKPALPQKPHEVQQAHVEHVHQGGELAAMAFQSTYRTSCKEPSYYGAVEFC